MNKYQSMISMFDESSQFLGSMGRYTGGGGASYDRSIYLELANASDEFRRDLKSERNCIARPRLNLVLNGHPQSYHETFKAEKERYGTFLIANNYVVFYNMNFNFGCR